MADQKKVFYVDIGEYLMQADSTITNDVMPDFLHLSAKVAREIPVGFARIVASEMEAPILSVNLERGLAAVLSDKYATEPYLSPSPGVLPAWPPSFG
jgi:hypothetical protein